MERKKPLVSVFVPYYNDGSFLPTSIKSILNQSYKNIELVLLNHACTDGSRDIAHSFQDERIIHIDMPFNIGYGGSGLLLKEFLKVANGRFLKFFCADDVLRPKAIEELVDYMQQNPMKDLVFGDIAYMDVKGNNLGTSWFRHKRNFSVTYNEIDVLRNYIQGFSLLPYIGNFLRREAIDGISLNTSMIYMFDMTLWVSMMLKGRKIGFYDAVIADYRISPTQTSSITKAQQALKISSFEWTSYYKLFLEIDDVNIAKEIFREDKYADKLIFAEDIPFIVAHYFLKGYTIYSYSTIADMLNDDIVRERLEERFGYGVREFRSDFCDTLFIKKRLSYKHKIYAKESRQLKIVELMFLLLRRIFYIDFFDKIRTTVRGKKEIKDFTI